MDNHYCYRCDKKQEVIIKTTTKELGNITIELDIPTCVVCEDEIYIKEISDINIEKQHNALMEFRRNNEN